MRKHRWVVLNPDRQSRSPRQATPSVANQILRSPGTRKVAQDDAGSHPEGRFCQRPEGSAVVRRRSSPSTRASARRVWCCRVGRSLGSAMLAGTLIAAPAWAEGEGQSEEPPFTVGSRVRLETGSEPGVRVVGSVVAIDRESLQIAPEGRRTGSDLRVAWASVSRLEAAHGLRRRTREGALIGGIPAGILGGVVALGGRDLGCRLSEGGCTGKPVFVAAVGAAVLGAIGAGIGAAIGSGARTDRWVEVPRGDLRPRISAAPGGNGVQLALTVRF
jgi:hypothetical protein